MPWILIPFLFLFSFQVHFINDIWNAILPDTKLLLIPLSAYLGFRYQQKGVITVGIGLIVFLIPYHFNDINIGPEFNLLYLTDIIESISSRPNQSLYLLLLIISSISAYYPTLFNKNKFIESQLFQIKYSLFVLLFFSILFLLNSNFYITFTSIIFAYLYLLFLGLNNEKGDTLKIFIVILSLHLLSLLFMPDFFSSGYGVSMKFSYGTLMTIVTMFFAYLVGKNYQKSLESKNILSNIDYLLLPVLLIVIIVRVLYDFPLKNEYIKYIVIMLMLLYSIYKYLNKESIKIIEVAIFITLVFPILLFSGGDIAPVEPVALKETVESHLFRYTYNQYLSMFIGLYLGIKYKKIGLYFSFILFIVVLILNLKYDFKFDGDMISIYYDNLVIIPNLHVKFYVELIVFSIIGYAVVTRNTKDIVYYDQQLIMSSSAKVIHRLWIFILLFFPTLFMGILVIRGLNSDLGIHHFFRQMHDSNSYFFVFVFTLFYLVIIYLPILISEGIIRRNGIIFNQSNFPQYKDIHQVLDKDFGKERRPLYIISPNKILLWGILTSRVFKIYSALHPVLLSSVFNQITKDEKQLLFLTYKQYSKIKLGHVKLWWYMYIVTFIPVLNILYFYAKRITYQNALLFTYIELKKKTLTNIQVALDATVTEETEAGISNVSQKSININGVRNIFFLWLSYFISRPHLQTQLYLLKVFQKYEDKVQLNFTTFGYSFGFKSKKYMADKYLTYFLSFTLSMIAILTFFSLQQPNKYDDISPVEPTVEEPIQRPIISSGYPTSPLAEREYPYDINQILEAIDGWEIDSTLLNLKYLNSQGGWIEPALPVNPTREQEHKARLEKKKHKQIEKKMHEDFVNKCIHSKKFLNLSSIKMKISFLNTALLKRGFISYDEGVNYKKLLENVVGNSDYKSIKQYLSQKELSDEIKTFISALLDTYDKVKNMSDWEQKFLAISSDDTIDLWEKYERQNLGHNPNDECMNASIFYEDKNNNIYLSEYESSIHIWLFSFWQRRYSENNMVYTKKILDWMARRYGIRH